MFIRPDKYMDLKTSIIKIAADIISLLLKSENKKMKFKDLHDYFVSFYKDDTNYIINPALNFLYLVGKIKYRKSNDELELII